MATAYIVLNLKEDDTAHLWRIADGKVETHSGGAAIRAVAERQGPGTYAAVPLSTWTQHVVTVETQTVVKLGEAA